MMIQCKNIKKFLIDLEKSLKKIIDYSQPIKYDDNYVKIKFNTDDNIPLNKIIYLPTITITIRSVTKKDDKCYL